MKLIKYICSYLQVIGIKKFYFNFQKNEKTFYDKKNIYYKILKTKIVGDVLARDNIY
jgi:hypothetical protein